MRGRYVVTIGVACLVTFGLFWVMQALISVASELITEKRIDVVDFVRLMREIELDEPDRKPPERVRPKTAPPPPRLLTEQRLDPGEGAEDFSGFDKELELRKDDFEGEGSDRDETPIFRVNPQYPMRAQQRGIEGWVEVEFTIGRAGTVEAAFVTAARPSGVFDRAALRAVQRWRYRAKIQNGIAVERPGIRVRLTFDLDD